MIKIQKVSAQMNDAVDSNNNFPNQSPKRIAPEGRFLNFIKGFYKEVFTKKTNTQC